MAPLIARPVLMEGKLDVSEKSSTDNAMVNGDWPARSGGVPAKRHGVLCGLPSVFLDRCGARGNQAQTQGMAEWAVLLTACTTNLLG